MTPPKNTARPLALALDAFLAEHRGCWLAHGEGPEHGQDDARSGLNALVVGRS
jgi:hypothetical protein